MEYSLICTEAQVLCIIFLAVLLAFNLKHRQSKIFHSILGIYILTIFAAVMDIVRILIDGKQNGILFIHMANILYLCCFGLIGYLWLDYCAGQYGFKNYKKAKCKILSMLPALTVVALLLISSKTGWIYYIDKNGTYHRGALYLLIMINYVYILIPGIVALSRRKSAAEGRTKRGYITLAASAIPAGVIGGLQTVMLPQGFSAMPFSVLLSLLIVFINSQYKKILIDNLTKLPNRYGMDEELQEQLEQYRRDKNDSFYIIACDMDNFKQINDTWGHLEGDRALRLIADVLARVAQQYNAEAFRIGGDEFVIITDTSEDGLAEKVCNTLKGELDRVNFRDDFSIKMSMGIALYDGSTTISELLNHADLELYEVKRKGK